MAFNDVEKLSKCNKERVDFLIKKDWAQLAELLSPQLVFIHSSGRFEGKESYLQSLMDGRLQYISMEMTDTQICVLDDSVGVVRGVVTTEIVSKGQQRVIRSYTHMTWDRNKEKDWILLSYSGTPLN